MNNTAIFHLPGQADSHAARGSRNLVRCRRYLHGDWSAAGEPGGWLDQSRQQKNGESFGAFLTICRIQCNNAEERIEAIRANGLKAESLAAAIKPAAGSDSAGETENSDLEALAQDQIAQAIAAKFKGHSLTLLVEAILKAQEGIRPIVVRRGLTAG